MKQNHDPFKIQQFHIENFEHINNGGFFHCNLPKKKRANVK